MIPDIFIEQWKTQAPWATLAMVEQDMIISKALIELYNQPKIMTSLAFRGGTALNKIFLNPAARYSEDLDFVQLKSEPIGETITAIRLALDHWLGEPKRKLTERSAKLIYRYPSIDNINAKLKVEINTTEHFHVAPFLEHHFTMDSEWFTGETFIKTYELDELMGTKLRALYQRRKGRDLFDLWYMLDKNLISPEKTVEIFNGYASQAAEPISRALFEKSLHMKKQKQDFRQDIQPLLMPGTPWDFEIAMELVQSKLISKLNGEAWKGSTDQ